MSLGYYSQAYKIYKNKSSINVSIITFIIFGIGTLSWLFYGFIINDLQIIIGFVLGVIGSWLVLILAFVYKKK